ncbi:MAG: hypothetical protein M0P71_00860 [Melioribacteraceae bacterium]|nr:hypothetical protein [Melioribacteraceae bacterium]
MSKQFKMMKIFDCQDFPKDIKKMFFDEYEAGNDCYVEYDICNDEEANKLTKYLMENGGKDGETVIIKHWW